MSELNRYLGSINRREYHAISIVSLALLALALGHQALVFGRFEILFILTLIPLAWAAVRFFLLRRYGLPQLHFDLMPKGLMVSIVYGSPSFFRNRLVFAISARNVKALGWTSSGLHVARKGIVLYEKSVIVPLEFFKDEKSIDALYEWAEAHGIPVEGVRPLPGAYVRSLEGPRSG